MTWQILEGKSEIPICLIEAASDVDAGSIFERSVMQLEGHELSHELRHLQGKKTIELCLNFCHRDSPPQGRHQEGEPSYYSRRKSEDSRLDMQKTLEEQFQLLRVVDNERYPAFFEHAGHRYKIQIEKVKIEEKTQ